MKSTHKRRLPGMMALTLLGCSLLWGAQAPGENVRTRSRWDFALPDLQLQAVSVNGHSPKDVWQTMSADLQVRSVLYLPHELDTAVDFTFTAEQCTVRQLFDAFVKGYPALTWHQDPKSGIIWFFPKTSEYSSLLNEAVRVPRDAFGLRYFTDVLEPLSRRPETNFGLWRRGVTFLGTFDFPVDIPAGTYSVRRLLNQCCVFNPKRTFAVLVNRIGRRVVAPYNMEPEKPENPTLAALHFWRTEIDAKQVGYPDQRAIRRVLSSPDPTLRWAGRCYVELVSSIGRDALVRGSETREEALWTAVGLMGILHRMEGTRHTASVERVEKEFDASFFEKGDPGLCALVAVEMARNSQDRRYLEILAKRHIPDRDLGGVRSEIFTLLRRYKGARETVAEKGVSWLGLGREGLLGLDKESVFGP